VSGDYLAGAAITWTGASAPYLERLGPPDFSACAQGHRVILTDWDLARVPEMLWFQRLTAKASCALRTNSRYAHRNAALHGLGIACLVRYLGDASPGLIRLPVPEDDPPPEREIWLAVHNDLRHTPRIRALTDFLTDALRRQSGVLRPRPR
jgi:DNA-binding transcriptional LysR family regulator